MPPIVTLIAELARRHMRRQQREDGNVSTGSARAFATPIADHAGKALRGPRHRYSDSCLVRCPAVTSSSSPTVRRPGWAEVVECTNGARQRPMMWRRARRRCINLSWPSGTRTGAEAQPAVARPTVASAAGLGLRCPSYDGKGRRRRSIRQERGIGHDVQRFSTRARGLLRVCASA